MLGPILWNIYNDDLQQLTSVAPYAEDCKLSRSYCRSDSQRASGSRIGSSHCWNNGEKCGRSASPRKRRRRWSSYGCPSKNTSKSLECLWTAACASTITLLLLHTRPPCGSLPYIGWQVVLTHKAFSPCTGHRYVHTWSTGPCLGCRVLPPSCRASPGCWCPGGLPQNPGAEGLPPRPPEASSTHCSEVHQDNKLQ